MSSKSQGFLWCISEFSSNHAKLTMHHESVPRVCNLVAHALIDLVNNRHKERPEGEMILA